MWLEPGQEDPWMGGGQWAAADSGGDAGYMMSFAILDEGGTSVTGTAAWSARWNAADETGHCVFSVQVKG
jgi:hypothetical protein